MNNVTIENKVALEQRINDPNKAGYQIVVYKKGAFFKLLAEGERFKKGFLEKEEDFTFFAVASQDLLLTYKFKSSFYHGHHIYDIEFAMEYGISDPKKITKQISLDPLRKVKEKAELIVSSGLKKIEWSDLIDQHYSNSGKLINDILSGMFQEPNSDKMIKSFDTINNTAFVYGIEIGLLTFRIIFTEKDTEIQSTKEDLMNRNEIEEMKKWKTKMDIGREEEIFDHKKSFEIKETVHAAQKQAIKDASKAIGVVMENISGDINSVGGLAKELEGINKIKHSLAGGSNSELENPNQTVLLSAASNQSIKSENLPLIELANLIKNSSVDLGVRKQILSNLLELVAYCLRSENPEKISEVKEVLYNLKIDSGLENVIEAPNLSKIVNEIENMLK
jgi:hypothetical protein